MYNGRRMRETQRAREQREMDVLVENLRKEHDKEILIHGIFMGVMIGSLFTGIMIDFLQKLGG
jgi:hypothetical protein